MDDLDAFMQDILLTGLPVFRERCQLPSLINSDYSEDAKRQGDTITIPMTVGKTTRPVVPGPTAPAQAPSKTRDVKIKLDYWEESGMDLTDKVIYEVQAGLLNKEVAECFRALANKVNSTIFTALYENSFHIVGTPGVRPFAYPAVGQPSAFEAVEALVLLEDWLAPEDGQRSFVMNSKTQANALVLPIFQRVDQSGDDRVLTKGMIARELIGFDWYKEQAVPKAPAVAITGGTAGIAVSGALPPQSRQAVFTRASLVGTLRPGDTFKVAGDPQSYVVTAASLASANQIAVSFYPGIQTRQGGLPLDGATGWASGAAVTFTPAHDLNFAFDRGAVGIAFRTLDDVASKFGTQVGGGAMKTIVDPISGVTMRCEIVRQHKQFALSLDLLWGVGGVIPEHIVRVAG